MSVRIISKVSVMLVLAFVSFTAAKGEIINVEEPVTASSIQTAVASASDGDVVVIPACNVNIDSQITVQEGIHVRGAGITHTILNKTSTTNWSTLFRINGTNGKPFKISGISFIGKGLDLFIADSGSLIIDFGVSIFGKAQDFEIYDCEFSRFSGCGIYIYGAANASLLGHATGVIHSNDFKDIYYKRTTGVNPSSRGYGVGLYGDDSWPELQLGTGNAVFIENNYFEHNRHCIADNIGGRYVFRYNTVVDNYASFPAIDAHGTTTLGDHGSRSYEIYGNNVSGGVEWDNGPGAPHATWAIGLRGGDGVIFDNDFYDHSKAMYTDIEGYEQVGDPLDSYRTSDQWIWNNTLDDDSFNTMSLGWAPADEDLLDDYLIKGTHIHEGSMKPGYVSYTYPHPLISLRGHWKLDNANTAQADASASGNNGVKYGSPSSVNGKVGNALDFDGTDDYIQVPYAEELNSTEFTVSAWAKVEGNTDTYRALLSSRGNNKGYNIYAGSNNKWQFWTGTGTGYSALSGPDIVNNQWTHVAVTYSNGTKKLYVNGVEYSGATTTFTANNSYSFYIGTTGGNYYFNGAIDDVRYFSKTLSQDEIKALYNRMPDPSFENDLDTSWLITSGTPTLDPSDPYDGDNAVCFAKATPASSQVLIQQYNYIPVTEGRNYRISVQAKGTNIVQGTKGYYKLFVIGRWYDKNMVVITGSYPDINDIPTGNSVWNEYHNDVTAPAGAHYYRVTAAGMLGVTNSTDTGSSGTGYLDMICFRPVE